MSRLRCCVLLLFFVFQGFCEVVEIDVNTGSSKVVTEAVESPPVWPDMVDLSGIRVHNPGEDATGSMSPRDLMMRAFQK